MPSTPRGEGPLILVVEDCEDTRAMYRACLESEGFRTAEAPDGQVAFEKVFAERPALVIMDLDLPGLSGREVTKRLKADASMTGVPIVVVSGGAAAEAESERRLLWDAFMSKPCRPEELVACIKSLLYVRSTLY